MNMNKISDLINTWIPLVIISAGIPLTIGSLLAMPQDKIIITSILAAVVAIIAFLLRPYFESEKEQKPQKNRY
ncbi:MAG: hypothetical protein K0S67_2149 [Nitrososphaeraceae archaeon]|jgi:hypothetical protein|nr:hypothetical protein [Nitrososphaeraceae archaeon]